MRNKSISVNLNILFVSGFFVLSMISPSDAIINGQTFVSGTVSSVSDDGVIEFGDTGYLIQIFDHCSLAEGRKAETLTEGWRLRAMTLGRELECQVFTGAEDAGAARDLGVPLLASCVAIAEGERAVRVGYSIAQLSIPLNSTDPNPYPCAK